MYKTILVLAILLYSNVGLAQSETDAWMEKHTQCHNGVKDPGEDGVDCNNIVSLKGGCNKCNGTFDFTLNGTHYISSIVQTVNLGLDKKATILQLIPKVYTDGTELGAMTITLGLRLKSFEEGRYKLVKTDPYDYSAIPKFWGFVVTVNFKMTGVAKGITKVKEGEITITKLDKMKRLISGTFKAYGTLDGGTPIELDGTFTDVNFD